VLLFNRNGRQDDGHGHEQEVQRNANPGIPVRICSVSFSYVVAELQALDQPGDIVAILIGLGMLVSSLCRSL
jgi:hypothetical protein